MKEDKINLRQCLVHRFIHSILSFPTVVCCKNYRLSKLPCNLPPQNVIFQDLVTKKSIGEGLYFNGLYYMSKDFKISKGFQASSSLAQDHYLWDQHLAHPSKFDLSTLFSSLCETPINETCHISEFSRLPSNSSKSRAIKLFEIVHFDVWSLAFLEYFDGYKYFVTFFLFLHNHLLSFEI